MKQLTPGDRLPNLVGRWTDGSQATVPADLDQSTTILLFYRGHW